MEIKTKYDIGQKLFFLDKYDGIYIVRLGSVRSINVGGKAHEKYQITHNSTRAENDLFTDFNEARNAAIEEQKDLNSRNLTYVKELKEPTQLS